jgi:hypothetical protein
VPEYAATDLHQIRFLRFGLAMTTPHLVGTQAPKDRNTALSTSMSPTEAAYVALSMLHQKLYNAKYQVTSKEWSQKLYRENWNRWNAHRHGQDVSLPSGPRLMGSAASARSAELHDAIRRATNHLSSGEIANLPSTVLDEMGVSR